jgi:hypothetical protein
MIWALLFLLAGLMWPAAPQRRGLALLLGVLCCCTPRLSGGVDLGRLAAQPLPNLRNLLRPSRQSIPATLADRSLKEDGSEPAFTWTAGAFWDFVKARSGLTRQPVYWASEGRLTNPLTGDVIALVQGLEVVRPLARSRRAGVIADLEAARGLKAFQELEAKGTWEAAAIVLATKVFVYVDPASGKPLDVYRPRRRGRGTRLPPCVWQPQAIAYVLEEGRLRLMEEVPEGALLSVREQSPRPYGGGGPADAFRRRFELMITMWPGATAKPPLSSLIQFGPSRSNPACRERYSLVGPGPLPLQSTARLSYVRLGEGPWWCGAGRVCQLELHARRYSRYEGVPRSLRQLIEERAPVEARSPPDTVQEFKALQEVRKISGRWFSFIPWLD